jgi:hypothetical protein
MKEALSPSREMCWRSIAGFRCSVGDLPAVLRWAKEEPDPTLRFGILHGVLDELSRRVPGEE